MHELDDYARSSSCVDMHLISQAQKITIYRAHDSARTQDILRNFQPVA